MKKIIFISLLGLCSATAGIAQGCKVMLKPLIGNYDGECRSKKANGRGKAVGIDSYEGDFRSGYPDGKGLYTWQNKNWYEGDWKNGMREGEGTMHITENGQDSVLTGFWKNDRYVGKYDKAYKILGQSVTVSTIDVRENDSKNNEIIVILSNVTGGIYTISSQQKNKGSIPRIKLSAVDVNKGSYDGFFSELPYQPNATKYILRKVTYPFTAYFRSENDYAEVTFYQEGSYTVDIKVLN